MLRKAEDRHLEPSGRRETTRKALTLLDQYQITDKKMLAQESTNWIPV